MMTTTHIDQLKLKDGEIVTVQGWLAGKRAGGKIMFLIIRDGTGICQCTVEAQHEQAFEAASSLSLESSCILTGEVRLEERAPGGAELSIHEATILQNSEEYPITRKAHGVDFLMSHRHLWLRSQRQTTILKIRHTLIETVRRFFNTRGFTLIDTPILSPGAAEGAGTLFPVDYFDEQVYLAQTGQLYLESACMALGKVYCFGPTFRAEKSKTRRHLTEFWMVEPEIAFAELPDLADLAEEMLCEITSTILAKHKDDLAFLERDLTPLEKIQAPFPRITYTEAIDLLHSQELKSQMTQLLDQDAKRLNTWIADLKQTEDKRANAKKGWQQEKLDREIHDLKECIRDLELDITHNRERLEEAQKFEWGHDLGGDEETILSRYFDKPIIVTRYPKQAKAFYMKQASDNPDVVLNMDVLAPEGYGEIIGGSQREDNFDRLLKRMAEENMDTTPYEWYLDLRRYGSVPHGGYGLGIERTLAWICGLKHIRETIPFPRLMGRIYP